MKLKLKVNSTIRQTLLRSISRTVNVAPQSRLAFTVSQRALSHLRASDPQYWFFHPLKQPHEHKFCMRLLLAASALVRRHMMGAWMLRNNPVCSPKQASPFFLKEWVVMQGGGGGVPGASGLWRAKPVNLFRSTEGKSKNKKASQCIWGRLCCFVFSEK